MIDEKTGLQAIVQAMHHYTHEGKSFMLSLSSVLDAFDIASPLSFLFATPNTKEWAHMVVHGSANTSAILQVFEDTGVAAEFNVTGGSAVVPKNRNRNSLTASVMTVTHTPTITKAEAAALLHSKYAAKAGIEETFYMVLKQNTKYLFRFLTVADNNEGSINLSWFETKDKTIVGSVGPVS